MRRKQRKKIVQANYRNHDTELDDDNIDFDALEADLGGDNNDADDDDDDDNAALEAAEFSVGDTIGKSLALVKQVSTV